MYVIQGCRSRDTMSDTAACQARIWETSAATRATVVSAIRYTFADTTQSYDELLAPLLVDFLSLMLDLDLVSWTLGVPQ